MKHQFIHILLCISMMSALLLTAACSREGQPEASGTPVKVSQVRMDVTIDRWDTATKTEGSVDWPEYARVYIQLTNGRQTMPLEATRGPFGNWNIVYYVLNDQGGWDSFPPDLTGFSGGHCKCFYFEVISTWNGDTTINGVSTNREADGSIHFMNNGEQTAVYMDDGAYFSVVDGVLEIKATLKPATGRIRIVAPEEAPDSNHFPGIYGMSHYTGLDRESFELTSTSNYFSIDLNTSVSTSEEWVYGFFSDPERRTLTFVDAKWQYPTAFERSFDEDILAPGSSSWTYLPTDNCHNEWYRYDGSIDGWNFNVDGLNMYYVVPGTFRMGGADAQPIHTVTLTRGFYLCQTEITKDMWYRVMGEPSDYANAAVPVTGKTWEEVQAFIAALNAKSGYSFRLPTEAEWEFAARGGMKSHGYKYSGGDDYADVAVRDGNWSMQAVKTKNANELSLYDMSGNASEWVNDWYAAYPTGTVVDPKGPDSGEVHVRRGGNRGQDLRYLTVTYRDLDSDLSLTGFRLAMDAPKIQ